MNVLYPELSLFDIRSEMAVHRRKLYVNGVWDSFYHLGRTAPKLTTLAVMTLVNGRHMTARVMYMFVQCMFIVEDMFFFYIQMAIKFTSEAIVGINRLQVGTLYCVNSSIQVF